MDSVRGDGLWLILWMFLQEVFILHLIFGNG